MSRDIDRLIAKVRWHPSWRVIETMNTIFFNGLTFTSKPRAYALTKSAPFWSDPISFVSFDVWQIRCAFVSSMNDRRRESSYPDFDASSLDVHAHLKAQNLCERSKDGQPIFLERSHPMRRDGYPSGF